MQALPVFFASIKKVWQIDKKYVIFTCFVFGVGVLPNSLGIYATAIFNQRLIAGLEEHSSYLSAYYPLVITFFATLVYGIVSSIWRWTQIKTTDKITSYFLKQSVAKASQLDYSSYDDPEIYDYIQKGWAQDGTLYIRSLSTIVNSFSYIFGLFTYMALLAYIDWKLMAFITAFRFLINPLTDKEYRWIYRLDNELAELRRKENYYRNFFGTVETTSEGKLFYLYDYAQNNFVQAHRKVYTATFIHKIKRNLILLLSNVVYFLPLTFGYVYLSIQVYKGEIGVADMTLFISLYVGFVDQVYNTITTVSGLKFVAEHSRHVRNFMSLPTSIYTDEDYARNDISSNKGYSLEFCSVSFHYPYSEKYVLNNISFNINENEMVSIIGANGAGKTTLIHLMMRLYDPTEGVILLNGKDIREYSVSDLYAIYGVLFQDYCDYATSVKESITFTTNKISEEKFAYSVKASTVNKFAGTLVYGYDTSLSRLFDVHGTELSVGQKQRIALARTYYKNAPILVFDEPSASIDPESEAAIFEAINELKGTQNIMLISHRLSTCIFSDRILLFKDGRLIGNGSHNELIKDNDEYKRMFQLQANKYEVS